jgi:hypothetical protein
LFKPETGIISVAAFLEDHPNGCACSGSSPDFEPSEEALSAEAHADHMLCVYCAIPNLRVLAAKTKRTAAKVVRFSLVRS